jgi:Flp pilus assembly protein TadD
MGSIQQAGHSPDANNNRSSLARAVALTARAQDNFDRGELPQAIALARAAARAGGGYRAYLIAGKALLADGRMAEAETELSRAAALAPAGNPDAAMLLERVRARRLRLGQ